MLRLNNPSPWFPLKVASQTRAPNVIDKAAPVTASRQRATRAELEKIGSEMHDVPTRVSTKFGSETRNVPTPFFRSAGYETLNEFITDQGEKNLRESQQAAASPARIERVVDVWGALTSKMSIPAGGSEVIEDCNLSEHTRLAVFCDEPVTLQISNTTSRTLRIRTLHKASGETVNVACLSPYSPHTAVVSANGESAAVIETMPS